MTKTIARLVPAVACLVMFAITGAGVAAGTVEAHGAQAKSCEARARATAGTVAEHNAFVAACRKGVHAPRTPTRRPKTIGAQAIVAPSGADRRLRSTQCNEQAAKLGLKDSKFQAFRKSCLASAGPVAATGASERLPTPTAAKDNLGALTNVKPH